MDRERLRMIAEPLVSNAWDTYLANHPEDRLDWQSIAVTILLDGRHARMDKASTNCDG